MSNGYKHIANNYDVPLEVLSVTPTRDPERNPSRRLADKHGRLFCGKTLDEWCAIQMWSNQCIARQIFVAETPDHATRLQALLGKYDVEVISRPRGMLHPVCDTGGLPIKYGVAHAFKTGWYPLITTPFVVSPCRRPGLYDDLVAHYLKMVKNPDRETGQSQVIAMVKDPPGWLWQDRGEGTQAEMVLPKTGVSFNDYPNAWTGCLQHFVAASWQWLAFGTVADSRAPIPNLGVYSVYPYPIEDWEDAHIDTEEQWQRAEWQFQHNVLDKLGPDCYQEYRRRAEDRKKEIDIDSLPATSIPSVLVYEIPGGPKCSCGHTMEVRDGRWRCPEDVLP